MSKLSKSVRTIGRAFEKSKNKYYGDLGLVLNGKKQVEVIGRSGYVYVRLRTSKSETIEALNGKVDAQYGLPVVLIRKGSRYEILEVNRERYSTWDVESSSVPRHGKTHTFDKDGDIIGNDATFISGYQFLPGLLSPFPGNVSTNVFIYPHVGLYSGSWTYYGNTGTTSLIPYKPQSGTSLVLVSIDYDTGNPHYLSTTGSYVPSSVTGMAQVLDYLPTNIPGNILPVGVVRLTPSTQTLDWRNIYDVRSHITKRETGTASSSPATSITIQDEGIPIGIPGTINFVGDNVSASISGSVVRVFVTGSAGGGGASLNFQDEGAPLGIPGTVNFVGAGVDVTVSGTVARVHITGSFTLGTGSWQASSGTHTHPNQPYSSVSSQSVTTSNVTAAEGTFYVLDVSGMTADRDFILPTPSAANKHIGLRISAGNSTYELLLKRDGSELTRLFVAGETIEFISTGTGANDWIVLRDGRVPCLGVLIRTGSNANTTNGAATEVTADWNAEGEDIGDICDVTNDYFLIRRNGKIEAEFSFMPAAGLADQKYAWIRLYKNSSQFATMGNRASAASPSSLMGTVIPPKRLEVSAGDTITAKFLTQDANVGMLATDTGGGFTGGSWFAVKEILCPLL